MARQRKKYSVSERVDYHKKRVQDPKVSEGKKIYSREWLGGFNDKHAENNYAAVCSEIQKRKGHMPRQAAVVLFGYRNGLKAKIQGTASSEKPGSRLKPSETELASVAEAIRKTELSNGYSERPVAYYERKARDLLGIK